MYTRMYPEPGLYIKREKTHNENNALTTIKEIKPRDKIPRDRPQENWFVKKNNKEYTTWIYKTSFQPSTVKQ